MSIATIVHVGKTLDFSNARAFKESCAARFELGARHFVIDFSKTGMLDSTGLGAIYSLFRLTSANNGTIAFACPTSPVRMVIDISKTSRIINSYPSIAEACSAIG